MRDVLEFDEFYAAPREQVWRAVTERETLARWLMDNDFVPAVGHAFELRDTPTPQWRGVIRCVVLELDAPHRMVWSWDGGHAGEQPSRVRFELTAIEGGTRLSLRHELAEPRAIASRRGLDRGWPRKLHGLRHALSEHHSDRIALSAPPAKVFDALTTVAGLRGWWTTGVSTPSPETLRFDFADGARGVPEHVIMRIDEAQAPSLVRWTCVAHTGLPDWVGTAPRFEIHPRGEAASELLLVHHGLTPQLHCHDVCVRGWSYFLDSIRRLVDEGRGTPMMGDTP